MHAERLLRLADKLEGKGPYETVGPVPEDHFNMGSWMNSEAMEKNLGDCGTTACACGWAASDPWFNERGLSLERHQYRAGPKFGAASEFDAICGFFDIDLFSAERLFMPGYDNYKPRQVAREIRTFVKSHQ